MINWYEALKAQNRIPVNDRLAQLFGATTQGPVWKTITGVLPLTFTAKGGTAVDWTIYGNTQGVGERTANIYNKTNIKRGTVSEGLPLGSSFSDVTSQESQTRLVITEPVKANGYTFACDFSKYRLFITYFDNNIAYLRRYDGWLSKPITINNTTLQYAAIAIRNIDNTAIDVNEIDDVKLMVYPSNMQPESFIPYGYQIPLTVSRQGQLDKTVDIYIGDSPLTEGQQVSKTSTGVDIELFGGENTVSTTLYNKPAMEIKYR